MARPRTPLNIAEATGRTAHDPQRYRDRVEPTNLAPLGEPTEHMDDMQCCVWAAFKHEIPWLMESDRAAIEAACALRSRLWVHTAETKDIAQLRILLSAFGATPADRSRISTAAVDDTDDPAARYIN